MTIGRERLFAHVHTAESSIGLNPTGRFASEDFIFGALTGKDVRSIRKEHPGSESILRPETGFVSYSVNLGDKKAIDYLPAVISQKSFGMDAVVVSGQSTKHTIAVVPQEERSENIGYYVLDVNLDRKSHFFKTEAEVTAYTLGVFKDESLSLTVVPDATESERRTAPEWYDLRRLHEPIYFEEGISIDVPLVFEFEQQDESATPTNKYTREEKLKALALLLGKSKFTNTDSEYMGMVSHELTTGLSTILINENHDMSSHSDEDISVVKRMEDGSVYMEGIPARTVRAAMEAIRDYQRQQDIFSDGLPYVNTAELLYILRTQLINHELELTLLSNEDVAWRPVERSTSEMQMIAEEAKQDIEGREMLEPFETRLEETDDGSLYVRKFRKPGGQKEKYIEIKQAVGEPFMDVYGPKHGEDTLYINGRGSTADNILVRGEKTLINGATISGALQIHSVDVNQQDGVLTAKNVDINHISVFFSDIDITIANSIIKSLTNNGFSSSLDLQHALLGSFVNHGSSTLNVTEGDIGLIQGNASLQGTIDGDVLAIDLEERFSTVTIKGKTGEANIRKGASVTFEDDVNDLTVSENAEVIAKANVNQLEIVNQEYDDEWFVRGGTVVVYNNVMTLIHDGTVELESGISSEEVDRLVWSLAHEGQNVSHDSRSARLIRGGKIYNQIIKPPPSRYSLNEE